jgi:hypothetical protein
MTDERFQLLPGTLELLVSRVLAHGELHGYEIARAIQERSKFYVPTRKGRIGYAAQAENWQRVSGAVGNVLRANASGSA